MAQVSRVHNVAQPTQIFHNSSISHKSKPSNSVSLRSQLWSQSKDMSLKHNNGVIVRNYKVSTRKVGSITVSASVAAAEKPSTAPEIVLQPIKDISGTITLPGSKSLSNRILLLAALSEVRLLNIYLNLQMGYYILLIFNFQFNF